ncbi:MAG: type II secretion system GspH family protein [Lentisphaeraceae bacterium]|nr:type II secretion system GspH family protein [Lentisphaeraceae bacterium]
MKKKFSLVELIAVISLMSILISFLMPALEKARQKARSSMCQNNLQQFSILFNTYSTGNSGNLPVAAGGSESFASQGWGSCIEQVMDKKLNDYKHVAGEDFGIWQCPENLVQKHPMGLGLGEKEQSYQPNGWNGQELYLETNYNWHENPSSLYALFDGTYYRTEPWKNTGGNTIYDFGISNVRYSHLDGINMLFGDGHVKWQPPVLNYRGTWQGGKGAQAYINGTSWYCR